MNMRRSGKSAHRDGIGQRVEPVLAVGPIPINQRGHLVGRTLGDPVTKESSCVHIGTNIRRKNSRRLFLRHHHARYRYLT
jgi:hypothetical protein